MKKEQRLIRYGNEVKEQRGREISIRGSASEAGKSARTDQNINKTAGKEEGWGKQCKKVN